MQESNKNVDASGNEEIMVNEGRKIVEEISNHLNELENNPTQEEVDPVKVEMLCHLLNRMNHWIHKLMVRS